MLLFPPEWVSENHPWLPTAKPGSRFPCHILSGSALVLDVPVWSPWPSFWLPGIKSLGLGTARGQSWHPRQSRSPQVLLSDTAKRKQVTSTSHPDLAFQALGHWPPGLSILLYVTIYPTPEGPQVRTADLTTLLRGLQWLPTSLRGKARALTMASGPHCPSSVSGSLWTFRNNVFNWI